ncbi:hypothetical protein ACFL3V_05215 [Nanoarchaeota archaeon]
MSRIIVPKHNFPVKHVAVSACQNVYASQAKMDKLEAKSLAYYIKNNLMPSLKFKRCADSIMEGYDENKAMFPAYRKAPLFTIPTIAALESGMTVSVVGSLEVGDVVTLLKEYYASIGKVNVAARLKWTPEYDGIDDDNQDDKEIIAENRKKLTLTNSMVRLRNSLNLEENDAFIFCAGDILHYDFPRVSHDKDIIDHSLVMDLNGRESIDPPIPRNFYHILKTDDGKEIEFKEPNIWILGAEFNLNHANSTYANAQKGGFGVGAFIRMCNGNMWRNPTEVTGNNINFLARTASSEAGHWISKKFGGSPKQPVIDQQDLESAAKFLCMSPVRVKAEHDDYLRLKDVDALHDYVFVRRLMEQHIDDVMPSHIAQSIKGFADYIHSSDVIYNIPTINEHADRMNEKVDRIQAILDKKKRNVTLEKAFDSNGHFIAQTREDEPLEAAVQRSMRDLERFYCSVDVLR